jgi:hypothetical protein
MSVTERRDLMVATKSELCCTGERATDWVCTGKACIAGAAGALACCLQPDERIKIPATKMLGTIKRFNDRPHSNYGWCFLSRGCRELRKTAISLHGNSNAPQGDFREYHGSMQVFKNGAGYKMKQVNQMLQSITEGRHSVRQS